MSKHFGCLAAIVVLQAVLFSSSAHADSIEFKPCDSQGKVNALHVSENGALPVQFAKGSSYTIDLYFVPAADHVESTVKLSTVLSGVPLPFPSIQDESPKSGLTKQGVTTRRLVVNVPSAFPSVSAIFRLEVMGKDSVREACVEFPVRFVAPRS